MKGANMHFRVWLMLLLAGMSMFLPGGRMNAADAPAEAPAIASDLAGLASINLEQVDLPAIIEEMIRLSMIPEAEAEQAREIAAGLQKQYDELTKLGAKRLFVHLRASDVAAGGTTWGIETDSSDNAAAVRDWVTKRLAEIKFPGDMEYILPKVIETQGRFVLGAPSEERLKAVIKAPDAPRPELRAAYESLLKADAGVLIFGDADGRRVVRELFPQLPAPFSEIDGELLADGIDWIAIHVKLPPEPIVTLALEAGDDQSADLLATAFDKAREVLKVVIAAEAVSGVPNHQKRAAALMPMVPRLRLDRNETRLSLTFGDDSEELTFLRYALPAITQDAREDAYRSTRINAFKQLALGMLNYESATKALPPASSHGDKGRPLLSWRVLILPYLGEQALYEQFRLDEPWDSEHNRTLIEKMPLIYADPSLDVRAAIGDAGRTTFVVPTGEGLAFGGKEGITYRAIKDGTSNTILLVEVPPGKAVVWTKPDDWEVDLQDPMKDLAREDRKWFTAGYADGHVSIHSTQNEPGVLRSLLTPNGGEVVEPGSIK
jgi:hypothetical protein